MATTTGFADEGVTVAVGVALTAVESAFALPHAVSRSAQAMSDVTMPSRRTPVYMFHRVCLRSYDSAERRAPVCQGAGALGWTTATWPIRIGVQFAPQYARCEKVLDASAELDGLEVDALVNWGRFFSSRLTLQGQLRAADDVGYHLGEFLLAFRGRMHIIVLQPVSVTGERLSDVEVHAADLLHGLAHLLVDITHLAGGHGVVSHRADTDDRGGG